MTESVYLLGSTKPIMIMLDRYGFEQGVRTPITYLLRVGSADDLPETLRYAGRFAYGALRADRRLKKKKYGVIVWSVVVGEKVRVTPIYVRHAGCPNSEFDVASLRSAWDKLFALNLHPMRFYEEEGEYVVDESPEVGLEFLEMRAGGGADFATPVFENMVEVVIPSK